MKRDQLDLTNAVVWISDSKTPSGEAEVPLTELALDAFRQQLAISGGGQYLFPRRQMGGVADEWVTQLLRQGDAQVFKKYSQMKLQMKREALGHINREANEMQDSIGTLVVN